MQSVQKMKEQQHDSKEGTKNRTYMLAGALSRCGSATIMYPIDVCKTRMQFQSHAKSHFNVVYRNSFHCLTHMIKHEGFGVYRGLGLRLLYIGPGAAITFSAYEAFRKSTHHSKETGEGKWTAAAWNALLMGATGRAVEAGIKTPFNIIKQQLQVEGQLSKQMNRGLVKSIKHIVHTKGIQGLFVGYTVTLARDLPFSFLYFSSYEMIKNKSQEYNVPLFKDYAAIRGAFAGSFASILTLPFDVIKTRIQTQHKLSPETHYSGYKDAVLKIMKKEGIPGFFRGLTPRLIYTIPSTSITFHLYELLKRVLNAP